MAETRIDGSTRREPVAEADRRPDRPEVKRPIPSREAGIREAEWIALTSRSGDSSAAADAAWAAVRNAPALGRPSVSDPTCASRLTGPDEAPLLAKRGVPLGAALERAALFTVPELERFIDTYVATTAARPELRALHGDAVRQAPEIFAKRLDREELEQRMRDEQQRMADRTHLMVVRPPLVIAQRAAVGEVAIPIARAVDTLVKLTPIAGELLAVTEVLTGKTLGGLGFDIPASERALTAALLAVPYAASALKAGVRGAAELTRLARATGRTTEETRRLCAAVLTLDKNKAALSEGLAALKAGRRLSVAQREAAAEAGIALQTIRGAAARSRLDALGQSMMSRAEKAALPTFAPNAAGVERSVPQALAIAKENGVVIPKCLKVAADPTVPIADEFAHYDVLRDVTSNSTVTWSDAAPEGIIVVRIHPSVLKSDEAIVGVLQHESYEIEQLRRTLENRGTVKASEVQRMIAGGGERNLHGQAWDVADLRVLIMREKDLSQKAVLTNRLERLLTNFQRMNHG